jgi:hypothetical protein
MTDDRSQRARAAAEAGTATREWQIAEAWAAYLHDMRLAYAVRFMDPLELPAKRIEGLRTMHEACLAHLDELARLIAQRDGYAAAQSIGPDVALNGWGSKR